MHRGKFDKIWSGFLSAPPRGGAATITFAGHLSLPTCAGSEVPGSRLPPPPPPAFGYVRRVESLPEALNPAVGPPEALNPALDPPEALNPGPLPEALTPAAPSSLWGWPEPPSHHPLLQPLGMAGG